VQNKSGANVGPNKMARLRTSLTAEENREMAMIECEGCHNFVFERLSYSEVEALLCAGSVSRLCNKCNKTTNWRQVVIHSLARGPKEKREVGRRGSKSGKDHIIH
jgi:hypothetical protein